MNKRHLKEYQYNWTDDPKHLRIDGKLPDNRCVHCARIFLGATFGISLCRSCDEAMSMCKDGPRNDYSSFLNSKQALANRDLREPIDFELESTLKRLEKETPNFTMATGKPLFNTTGNEEEDERIRRLYSLD